MKYKKIKSLLKKYDISYIERGKNVKAGNINISCPFCGTDPSKHMGIDLTTGFYGCWRDSRHRGHNIFYLLSYIIKIDQKTLRDLLPKQNFLRQVQKNSINKDKDFLKLDKSFLDPEKTLLNCVKFDNFLIKRGFSEIESFKKAYELLYCFYGEWKDRIIFPLRKNGALVSWHTRTINNNEWINYKDISVEKAIIHPKRFLWQYDSINTSGDFLYLTEGIFDALKLDFYSAKRIRATCLFTKTIREEQIRLIYELKDRYIGFYLCLDSDALAAALVVKKQLYFLKDKLKIVFLPDNLKDPGEMSKQEVKNFTKTC